MADADLDTLVSLWQQARDEGRSLSPAELCAGRPELADELARRIDVLQKLEGWGKQRRDAGNLTCPAAPPLPMSEGNPTRVGDEPPLPPAAMEAPPGYELLSVLGRGGMGIVYRARQKGLNRLVALKMILGGAQAGEEERLRFLAEAETLAALRHEGIVQVHDFGTCNEVPWFALEFCAGGTLEQRLAGKPQPPRDAARIVRRLALAMQAAHDAGIVHRDLKPANVLLAQKAQIPNPNPRPGAGPRDLPEEAQDFCEGAKITDFGLAKRLDSAGMTRPGAIMGTPSYMPPEQARGDGVGPAADQYALGAIFYECLVGKPPFLGATPHETLLQVATLDPVPVRRFQPRVPRDLDTICLKCLEKEPARRYASCQALADDLGRFLGGEPIQARAAGPWGRAEKWLRRNPVVAALVAGLVLLASAALLAIGLLSAEAARARDAARHERDAARVERRRAETLLYASQLASAQRETERGGAAAALRHLDCCRWDLRGWEHRLLFTSLQGGQVPLAGHTACVSALAVSPSGRYALSGGLDRSLRLWDLRSGETLRAWKGEPSPVRAVAFSRDGRLAISGGQDGAIRLRGVRGTLAQALPHPHKGAVAGLAVSPEGSWMASVGCDRAIQVRALPSGELLHVIQGDDSLACVAISPDGASLAVGQQGGTVRVYDCAAGRQRYSVEAGGRGAGSVAFSPDGKILATGGADRTARLWDAASGRPVRVLRGHRDRVSGLAFSPDSQRLASSSHDDSVRVWDVASGGLALKAEAGGRGVGAVAWGPRGHRLLLGCEDGAIRVLDGWRETGPASMHEAEVTALAWSPDGRWLASASRDRTVRVMPRQGGPARVLRGHRGEVSALAWAADGKTLFSGGADRAIRAWAMPSGVPLRMMQGHSEGVSGLAVRPGGKLLASVSADGTARLWEAASGQPRRKIEAGEGGLAAVAWSPDGQRLAVGGEGKAVVILDPESGQASGRWTGHARAVSSLAWSPDGRCLASASADQTAMIWDAGTGRAACVLEGHAQPVTAAAWSPDGTRLATAGEDNHLALWDAATGLRLLSLPAHARPARCAAFSPDGAVLASGGLDHAVKLWAGTLAPSRLALQRHPLPLASLERQGGLLVGFDRAGTRVSWDAATGRLSATGGDAPELEVGVEGDGEPVVIAVAQAEADREQWRGMLAALDEKADRLPQSGLRCAALAAQGEEARAMLARAGEAARRSGRATDRRVRAILLLKAGLPAEAKAEARRALVLRKADGPPLEELLLAACCRALGEGTARAAWHRKAEAWQGEWCPEASREKKALEKLGRRPG